MWMKAQLLNIYMFISLITSELVKKKRCMKAFRNERMPRVQYYLLVGVEWYYGRCYVKYASATCYRIYVEYE